MTTKLYWKDSHLTHFTATISRIFMDGERQVVVLDQTTFYPTGGGQPCDWGTIDSVRVLDVVLGNDGSIFHYLEKKLSKQLGDEVEGEVLWSRRQDFIQQHTGQHILSQSYFQLFGAETKGFRINADSSEIDLTLDVAPEQILPQLKDGENLANEIVWANKEIRTHFASPENLSSFPLRKETFVDADIRIIEIADFDWSACGGTHAKFTGEIGAIVIRNWERAKQMIRVEFLCGNRVLQDYRTTNLIAKNIAEQFSVAREQSVQSVTRLIEESKSLKRQLRQSLEISLKYEAMELLQSAFQSGSVRVVLSLFENRSFDEIKTLAHQLVASESVLALLILREAHSLRIVFARSINFQLAMGDLMRETCQIFGGKGGGTSDFAQGGGFSGEALEPLQKWLLKKVQNDERAE